MGGANGSCECAPGRHRVRHNRIGSFGFQSQAARPLRRQIFLEPSHRAGERFEDARVHIPVTSFGGRMSKDLDRRVKAALDETRLLILGVQVLLGFEFQCFFQDGFSNLSASSKFICVLSLLPPGSPSALPWNGC